MFNFFECKNVMSLTITAYAFYTLSRAMVEMLMVVGTANVGHGVVDIFTDEQKVPWKASSQT